MGTQWFLPGEKGTKLQEGLHNVNEMPFSLIFK